MAKQSSARIHPSAVISAEAELADQVEVGPFTCIEGPVRLGPGCILGPHVHLTGPLTMGAGNRVLTGAVLGQSPYESSPARATVGLVIGDHNVFREHVTIHRSATSSGVTRIGSHNFLMAGCHINHDCCIGDRCILANGAVLGSFCTLENNAYVSGNSAVRDHVRIGRLALLSGCSATTRDIPPFVIQQHIDMVAGINVVGMRRAGLSSAQIDAIRQAFRILYRDGLPLHEALARIQRELGTVDVVTELLRFMHAATAGINPLRSRCREAA